MTRTLKISLGAIVVLILLVAFIAWLVLDNLDRLVTDAIESNGSAATGTGVNADGLHIALRAAEGDIAELSIDNPPGFEADHAIRFENIHLTLDPATLLDQTVHVRELRVDAAQVNLEQRGSAKSNLQTLIDNVNAYSGSAGEPAEESKNIVIGEFILEQAELTVRSELLGNAELTLPSIRATDVGSDSAGATAAEALEEVLQPILAEALDQAGNRAVEAGRERIEEEVGERLQDLVEDQTGE